MASSRFTRMLQQAHPPADAPPLVQALWHEGRGDWETAHEIAQQQSSADAAWVHAYLHRREGDTGNAAYWYRQAGQPVCRLPLDEERTVIAEALLNRPKEEPGA